MHCNQPFCGNGFTTGQRIDQCGYNPCQPHPQNTSGIYPQIVGEGEVTTVTLPDGTVQYFFIPTIKWWAPQQVNSYPYFPNIGHTNNNQGCYGTNITAWFVRAIYPGSLQPHNNPFCRHDSGRLMNTSENNLNNGYIGHQLKFHNDKWTSTTHLQYFFPQRMCQLDCTLTLPSKGCAAIQVDTPMNTIVRHYDSSCSKPCKCKYLNKGSSAMSFTDMLVKSENIGRSDCPNKKNVGCDIRPSSYKGFNYGMSAMSFTDVLGKSEKSCSPDCPNKKNVVGDSNKLLNLLPKDSKTNRIKLFDKPETKAQCPSKCSLPKKVDSVCTGSEANEDNDSTFKKTVDHDLLPSAEKSVMSFTTDSECSCEKCTPTIWSPKTKSVAKYFRSPANLTDSSSCSCSYNHDDIDFI